MTSVEYKNHNDMILEPIRIVMINMNGIIYNIHGKELNLNIENIFDKFKKTKNIIGIKYGLKTKGIEESKKKANKKTFLNSCQFYVNYKNKYDNERTFKIKVTRPGSIHIPGCLFLQDSTDIIEIIYNYLVNNNFICPKITNKTINFNKKMYTSQLTYNFQYIDMLKFAEIIREEYKVNALYLPSKYYALKVYYKFKNNDERNTATIILYKSGKCAINGTNHRYKIREVYDWFNKLVFDNYKRIDAMIE